MGTTDQLQRNRLEQAALLSQELLSHLENPENRLSVCSLKAHRLALLMHDEVELLIIRGLMYGAKRETRGVRELDSFSQEVRERAYRISRALLSKPDTRKATATLFEEMQRADSPAAVLPDTLVAAAPISELENLEPEPLHPGYCVTEDEFLRYVRKHMDFSSQRALLGRIRSWLHHYASGVNIRVQFADVIDNVLESYRTVVDARLADICPEALDMLAAAYQRLPGASSEERSQAITTLRRVLKAFADAVYPPRRSAEGQRELTDQHYINRLWALAEENIGSKSNRELVQAQIENLGHWIDAVYRSQDKGVHATVSQEEAERLLLHTYLLLGDLIRLGDQGVTRNPR